MKTTRHSLLATAFALFSVILPASAAVTTFVDSAPGAAWVSTKVTDTTLGKAATFSIVDQTTGGNPGEYRQVTHNYSFGGIGVVHTPDTATTTSQQFSWYPISQGEVLSIDYSYDLNRLSSSASSGRNNFGIMIQQGSHYYRPTEDSILVNTWTTFSRSGLTANNFNRILPNSLITDTTLHPDFSAGAPTILLGYWTGNSSIANATHFATNGIDNFRINIHHNIPEPSAALLGLGALGLVLRRRKH